MDRNDQDRTSIFSRPDADLEADRPVRPAGPPSGPLRTRPEGDPPLDRDLPELPEGLSRQVIVLGSMGLAILALGGFIAASVLGPNADPALAGASLDPTPSASEVEVASDDPAPTDARSAEPTASATEPTPEPTPVGPPHEVARGGWVAVMVGELNVRRDAGLGEGSVYRLVRGAVAYVSDGPVAVDGYNWYRIASLGGARGWAAAGTEAAPFLRTVTDSDVLVHCDAVSTAVWTDPDGDVRITDPIRIGDLALPAAAFDDFELGVLNLLFGTGGQACITATVDVAGTPIVYPDLFAIACGRPDHVADHETLVLHPAAGQDVVAEYQVKRETIVHGVLSSLVESSPSGTNLRGVLEIAAYDDTARRCVHARSTEGPGSLDRFQQVDGHQCLILEEWTPNNIRLATPTSDPRRVTLVPVGGVNESIAIGTPLALYLVAYDFHPNSNPGMSVGASGSGGCS